MAKWQRLQSCWVAKLTKLAKWLSCYFANLAKCLSCYFAKLAKWLALRETWSCIQGVLRKSVQKHEKTCPNHQHPLKIWQKSVQNQPKANLKSMKMCPWTVFGRRSRPDRPQDAKGSSKDLAFGSLLAENGAPRVTCWTPLGTKLGSEIPFLRVAWRFLPPKIDSGKGFWKNMKNNIFCRVSYDTLMLLNIWKTL